VGEKKNVLMLQNRHSLNVENLMCLGIFHLLYPQIIHKLPEKNKEQKGSTTLPTEGIYFGIGTELNTSFPQNLVESFLQWVSTR
jgi:hypothetical protein